MEAVLNGISAPDKVGASEIAQNVKLTARSSSLEPSNYEHYTESMENAVSLMQASMRLCVCVSPCPLACSLRGEWNRLQYAQLR